MAVISMKQLLEAGVHFGHQTRRWNPKMAPYIFTERNGIYIIDLQKTVRKVDEAYNFIRDVAMAGKTVLFVGTKKQAQESIESEAKRCNMYYVNNRWLGGMLTNFRTIRSRVERLNEIDRMEQNGQFELRLRKEYKYDWNTDAVKFQFSDGSIVYEKEFASLSALKATLATGPIILE